MNLLPIWVARRCIWFPIGNTQYVRDIIVQSVFCPAVAMRNDDIVIEAVIQAYDCEGEACLVELAGRAND